MIVDQNIICFEFHEMIASGISERTLKSWDEPLKVPYSKDKRVKLFPYCNQKPKYQEVIKAKYGEPKHYLAQIGIKELLKPDPKAHDFYRTYRVDGFKYLPEGTINDLSRASQWANMMVDFGANSPKKILHWLGMASRREFYDACVSIIKAEGIKLPTNYSRLMEKLREYGQTTPTPSLSKEGSKPNYAALIKANYGNSNSAKISAVAGDWLCAYYGCPFPKATVDQTWTSYNQQATEQGWPAIESPSTINKYLHRPDVIQRWYGNREGHREADEKFGLQLKVIRASCRDALWFSDGTGLNFYASDSRMQRVYWVVDDHSEVILGWDIAPTENESSVYRAFKNAVNFAGHKPYEVRYDNGSGNNRLASFLDRIVVKKHQPTMPHNGKSKSIEPVTYRFQRQVMNKYWFFSGQNRDTKASISKVNVEAMHEVNRMKPDFETVKAVFAQCVAEWNSNKHPKLGKSRLEIYQESVNPFSQPFRELDTVAAFWNTATRPITYQAAGLYLTVNGTKYHFEVQTNGLPDLDFRKKYIGEQFTVKYDPDDITAAWLYLDSGQGLEFVAVAEPKEAIHIASMDIQDGEAARLQQLINLRKRDNAQRKATERELAEEQGLLPTQIATKQNKKIKELTLAEVYREDDNYQPVSLYGRAGDIDEMKILEE